MAAHAAAMAIIGTHAILYTSEPDAVRKQIQGHAVRIGKELARRAPSVEDSLIKWLDVFNRGKLTVEVDTSELNKAVAKVGDLGRTATIGLIVVGQLIGTAIVMAILLQPALAFGDHHQRLGHSRERPGAFPEPLRSVAPRRNRRTAAVRRCGSCWLPGDDRFAAREGVSHVCQMWIDKRGAPLCSERGRG